MKKSVLPAGAACAGMAFRRDLYEQPAKRRTVIQILLVMKLTMLLLTAAIFSAHASGLAQTVSLKGTDFTYRQVFSEIEKQTRFGVFGEKELIRSSKKANIQAQDLPLEELLNLLLRDLPYEYEIAGKTVFITKKPADAPFTAIPPFPIKLLITDASGKPLARASVTNKHTKYSGWTDADGLLQLDVNVGNILEVSYVGYEKQSIIIRDNSPSVSITLKTAETSLQEVIVNKGYYTEKKRFSTGSVIRVDGKEIEKQPVTNPLMALKGRVPGLDITPSSGVPGGAVKVEIRGRNSIRWDGGQPLFIVDGVPIESAPIKTASYTLLQAGLDPLGMIDMENIESIEVLKDADATAIYGSRGANGVILITSKKADKAGKTTVSLNAYHGIGKMTNRLKLLNTEQYMQLRHEAYANDGVPIPDENTPFNYIYDVSGIWDTTRYTDWQKELLGVPSTSSDLALSVSSRSEHTSFNIGMGYHRETAIFSKEQGAHNLSGNFAIDHISPNKRLSIGLNGQYGSRTTNLFGSITNPVDLALTLPPNAPALFQPDGQLNWEIRTLDGVPRATFTNNPMASLLETHDIAERSLIVSGTVGYEILKDLRINARLGFTDSRSKDVWKKPLSAVVRTYIHPSSTSSATFGSNVRSTWLVEPYVSYEKSFGKNSLSIIAGATAQESNSFFETIAASGYKSDVLLNSVLGAQEKYYDQTDYQYRYTAGYGRIGYNYDGRYILNLTGRRDGSSRFGPGNQFGNFGAVGAAWIFTEERWLKNTPWLSFGKLRGSYGITGNDQIGDYKFLNTYTVNSVLYEDASGFNPTGLFNPNLAWEETEKVELGLELGFAKDKIILEVSGYSNKTSNQLVQFPLTWITGFSQVNYNLDAVVGNRGLEAIITAPSIINTRKIKWSSSFNISIQRNKLLKFDGIEESPYSTTFKVGESLNVSWLFAWNGVNPETGEFQFRDVNNDGMFSDDDRYLTRPLGRTFYGGMNHNLKLGDFTMDMQLEYSQGRQYNAFPSSATPGGVGNQPTYMLDRWRKPGDVTNIGKATQIYSMSAFYASVSDMNLKDVFYVRLRTFSLAYNIPAKILSKARFNYASIFLQGQNLVTLTKYKEVLDPETGYSLPPLKILSLGVQVKL